MNESLPFSPSSSPPPFPVTGAGPSALRRATVRSVIAVVLLGAGVAAVYGLETMLNATFDKPAAPLSKLLPEMGKELGTPVRYRAVGSDEVLTTDMIQTLGTTDYLVRRYQDTTLTAGEPGSLVNLNLNYYDTGSGTPHVPEVCWAGSGREEAPGIGRGFFVVSGVRRKDGSAIDLPMKMISFVPVGGQKYAASGAPLYSNVAYVFHVNGDYVAGVQEVASRFWKASNKYAYHCKIEVTPLDETGRVLDCTQEQAKQIVGAFIRDALPEIEACLPDPAILTGRGPETGAETKKVK